MSRPADAEVISLSSDSDEDAAPAPGPSRPLAPQAPRPTVPAGFRALDDASRAHFHAAIATAPDERVRETLAALVDSVHALPEHVFGMLVAERPQEEEWDDDDDGSVEQQPREKVMVPRWEICKNCGEEFDAGEEREEDECRYHTGELDVDEEVFVDWDDWVHGPKDTEENRRQFPENFVWTCCEEDGTHPGCTEQEHEPEDAQGRRKRARR
ncbi:hypothetical protein OH77DRAFT_1419483 [Trametes cingulata]|nr:hypothetical protein OH77DRAFT_1419483 [Trametes cingulata]